MSHVNPKSKSTASIGPTFAASPRPRCNPTDSAGDQEGRRKRRAHRPRMRRCLLKGCEQRFHFRHARQRYCCAACREAPRKWSRWKAQQRYRATAAGKRQRNGQGQRYRDRVKSRNIPEPEGVNDPARVIATEHFFRSFLRPGGLLREIRAPAAKPFAALLLTRLPACAGARPREGAELERGARLSPDILIPRRDWPYIQPECNWSFTSLIVAGSTCGFAIRSDSGGCWPRWPRPVGKRPSW
jgi:hypothetical protein